MITYVFLCPWRLYVFKDQSLVVGYPFEIIYTGCVIFQVMFRRNICCKLASGNSALHLSSGLKIITKCSENMEQEGLLIKMLRPAAFLVIKASLLPTYWLFKSPVVAVMRMRHSRKSPRSTRRRSPLPSFPQRPSSHPHAAETTKSKHNRVLYNLTSNDYNCNII